MSCFFHICFHCVVDAVAVVVVFVVAVSIVDGVGNIGNGVVWYMLLVAFRSFLTGCALALTTSKISFTDL